MFFRSGKRNNDPQKTAQETKRSESLDVDREHTHRALPPLVPPPKPPKPPGILIRSATLKEALPYTHRQSPSSSSLPEPVASAADMANEDEQTLAPPSSSSSWHEDVPSLPFLDEVRAARQYDQTSPFPSSDEDGSSRGSLSRRLSKRGRRSLNRVKAALNLDVEAGGSTLAPDFDAQSAASGSTAHTYNSGSFNGDADPATGLPFALDRDNAEFHRLYSQIGLDEHLIEDYACAWNKDGLLIQGRMWLAQHHVCFKGWTQSSNICIPLTEIIHIEKKNIALVIPNSIEIELKDTKYFFASFFNRDGAFNVLQKLWDVHVEPASFDRKFPEPAVPCSCGGVGACDTCYIKAKVAAVRSCEGDCRGRPLLRLLPIGRDKSSDMSSLGSGPVVANSAEPSPPSPRFVVTTADGQETSLAPPTPPESPGPEKMEADKSPAECSCGNDHKRMRRLLEKEYPLPIEELWNRWFTNRNREDGGWYGQFLVQNRKVRDFALGPWVNKTDNSVTKGFPPSASEPGYDVSFSSLAAGMHRTLEYILPLSGPIGPKQTRCTVVDEILSVSQADGSLCLSSRAVNPDVPSGNAFHVITRTCLLYSSPSSTRVIVSMEIVFTKSSWLKAAIEKATPTAQAAFYKELDASLSAEIRGDGKTVEKKVGKKMHMHSAAHAHVHIKHRRSANASSKEEEVEFTESSEASESDQVVIGRQAALRQNILVIILAGLLVAVLFSLTIQAVALWKVAAILERVNDRAAGGFPPI